MWYDWLNPFVEAARQISYKDWSFNVDVDEHQTPFLQITFWSDEQLQVCRKWLLYHTMNVSEFVKTCWMAVLAAEEHEAREAFRFRGVKVMNPHVDVEKLAEFYRLRANLGITSDPE